MSDPRSPLRLNVGFIVHQSIGYSRDFDFAVSQISIQPDLALENLSGTVRVTRTPQGLLSQVKMHASVLLECVRCLEGFSQDLSIDFTELYAFTSRSVTDSGLILPEDGHIDLSQLVREYMLLDVPIKPVCTPACKGLCPVCGENLNRTHCDHGADEVDPRLAGLSSLLKKK